MKPDRLNALTDGVVAIAITIIVLELPLPREPTFAGLRAVSPMLLAYLLSFINIGIFWNNHHHMLTTASASTAEYCGNLGLIFSCRWCPSSPLIDEAGFSALPCAAYGMVLAARRYRIADRISHHPASCEDGTLAQALGSDWKAKLSTLAIFRDRVASVIR